MIGSRTDPATARLLARSPYDHAVEAFDRPFNTHVVLSAIRDDALRLGCQFEDVALSPGCVNRSGAGWELTKSGNLFDKVVIAAGAYTATLALSLKKSINYEGMWITVLAVKNVQLRVMLLSLGPYHLNMVPFGPRLGDGFTAILAKADERGDPVTSFIPVHEKAIKDAIAQYYPAIDGLMQSGTASAYACTKLVPKSNATARGAVIESLDKAGNSLWAFYPGKFTTALLAARECANEIQGSPTGAVDVAPQPYS